MEIIPDRFSVEDYIGNVFSCKCGNRHTIALKKVVIKSGAINDVADIIKELNCKYPMIICGPNGGMRPALLLINS